MLKSSPSGRGNSPSTNGYYRSPSPNYDERFQFRNSEDIHNDILMTAQLEHKRVRDVAISAYHLHEARVAHLKTQELVKQEEERAQIETLRALEQIRLHDAQEKAKQIPIVPESVPVPVSAPQKTTPVQPTPALPVQEVEKTTTTPRTEAPAAKSPVEQPKQTAFATPAPQVQELSTIQIEQQPSTDTAPVQLSPSSTQQYPVQEPSKPSTTSSVSSPPPKTALPLSHPPHHLPHIDRYEEIHKMLKELRASVAPKSALTDPRAKVLKKEAGDIRRAMKQAIGQLTGERGANKEPLNKIKNTLRQARDVYSSPPMDPSAVHVSKPSPKNGAANNGDTLPALFIYALHMFSKAVVAQFTSEASIMPEKADPIGIIAVSIFSQEEFCWRGKPLIDILIAKLRVACPVLFGLRGSEKTMEGRIRLGWRRERDGGGNVADAFISAPQHQDRMKGVGAGYASIALRDFSRTSMQNPWPPSKYWETMACIVSTPADQMSSTQMVVLRGMIELYEQKFINFYGNAALAALKVALVDFPDRSLDQSNVAVSSLRVLVLKIEKDLGLRLPR